MLRGGQGGLVHLGENGNLAWFNGVNWTKITGGKWGTYNLFAEYISAYRAVWLGAGTGGERTNYKLDAQLNLTRLAEAPLSLNVGASLKSTDPVSGMHLVTDLKNGAFWEFDMGKGAGRWTELKGMKGEVPDMGNEKPMMHIPMAGH